MRLPLALALAGVLIASTADALESCDYFFCGLTPEAVVPPASGTLGHGWSELQLCSTDSLNGWMSLNLDEAVNGVHLHGPALRGEVGPLLFDIPLPELGSVQVHLGGVGQYRELFIRELCYFDVHTSTHPEGALRGQIWTEGAVAPAAWTSVKQLYR
jgi:hypothetical protein